MAKATAKRAEPVVPPIESVTLELDCYEAENLLALMRAVGGVGPVRNIADLISTELCGALGYETNLINSDGRHRASMSVSDHKAKRGPIEIHG